MSAFTTFQCISKESCCGGRKSLLWSISSSKWMEKIFVTIKGVVPGNLAMFSLLSNTVIKQITNGEINASMRSYTSNCIGVNSWKDQDQAQMWCNLWINDPKRFSTYICVWRMDNVRRMCSKGTQSIGNLWKCILENCFPNGYQWRIIANNLFHCFPLLDSTTKQLKHLDLNACEKNLPENAWLNGNNWSLWGINPVNWLET